jgi:hypothetical protein
MKASKCRLSFSKYFTHLIKQLLVLPFDLCEPLYMIYEYHQFPLLSAYASLICILALGSMVQVCFYCTCICATTSLFIF